MSHLNHVIYLYKHYLKSIDLANKSKALKLNARCPNFPSEVSEYMAKTVLMKAWNLEEKEMTKYKKQSGDLVINYAPGISHKIEVKCFSSNGPISFGPTEYWDYLLLIDARKKNLFYVYLVDQESNSEIIKNLQVSKTETFGQQCKHKRRPRIRPNELIIQLKNNIKLMSSGKLMSLCTDR